jgi:excisionase family DNA binding protein
MVTEERLTYNVKEAAKLLGLSRNSAYQACLKGEIPHLKIGKRILIPRVQLERLLLGNGEAKNGEQ